MSSSPLKILALEPYFDSHRRQVLTTLTRRSRHEWTLLKLPARRVDRRLAAASRWFAEVIDRGGFASHVDLLLTGEMLNMRDLIRCVPKLGRVPSVVYFHDNQTPPVDTGGGPLDLVNLNTAMAATEVWFNSQWHLDEFLARAESLVERQPEIAGRHPTSDIRAKSQVLLPPTDFGKAVEALAGRRVPKNTRTLLVDTRGIDVELLVDCVRDLEARHELFELVTVGPERGLPDDLPRLVIHERDEPNQLRALQSAGIYLSLRQGATADTLLAHAMHAGCWPVVPQVGSFPEYVAPSMHEFCLHDGTVDSIVGCLLLAFQNERSVGAAYEQDEILESIDASKMCRVVDDMLEEVAAGQGLGTH